MLSYKLDRTVKCYYYRYVYNLQANVQRRRNLTQAHTWVYGGFTAPGRRWHQLNGVRRTYRACRVRRVWCVYCTLYVVAVRSAVTDAPRWARPTPGARPSAPRGGPC